MRTAHKHSTSLDALSCLDLDAADLLDDADTSDVSGGIKNAAMAIAARAALDAQHRQVLLEQFAETGFVSVRDSVPSDEESCIAGEL